MVGALLTNAKIPLRIHVKDSEFSKAANDPICRANKKESLISPLPIAPLDTMFIKR